MSKASAGAVAVLAAATLTPVAVVGMHSVADESALPTHTSTTGSREVALDTAPAAKDVPQDVAGGGNVVKEVTSDTPFTMVGVTWDGDQDGSAKIRAKQADGSWGQWFDADSVADDLDAGKPKPARSGTEPVFLGAPTTAVQISLSGVDVKDTSIGNAPDAMTSAPSAPASGEQQAPGAPAPAADGTPSDVSTPAPGAGTGQPAAATGVGHDIAAAGDAIAQALAGLGGNQNTQGDVNKRVVDDHGQVAPAADSRPSGVQAVLLSPDMSAADSGDDAAPTGGQTTGEYNDVAKPAMPNIISRKGWGADESIRCQDPYYDDGVSAATVHHTAGSNDYTKEQSAGVVRGIYTYHAQNLGWCDVGYNVLVDKYGQAFEGRYGGLDKAVEGAHAGGFNSNTFGISMMGDYSSVQPSKETIQKVGEIIGWKLAISGVDPLGKAVHYSEGTEYTKYPQGQAVTLPNIFAHRDVGLTTCPGDSGYAQMDNIRKIASQYAKNGGGSAPSQPSNPAPSKPTPSKPSTGESTSPRPNTGGGAAQVDSGSLERALSQRTGVAQIDQASSRLDGIDKAGIARQISALLMGGRSINLDGLKLLGAVSDLKSINVVVQQALTLANGGNLGQLWSALGAANGPLGRSLSGVQKYQNVSYAKFENGAIYESDATGAHPVWGAIGDAWAAQGFEHGALGLPTSGETKRADGTVAQQFQHGTLVFDPTTSQVHVEK